MYVLTKLDPVSELVVMFNGYSRANERNMLEATFGRNNPTMFLTIRDIEEHKSISGEFDRENIMKETIIVHVAMLEHLLVDSGVWGLYKQKWYRHLYHTEAFREGLVVDDSGLPLSLAEAINRLMEMRFRTKNTL